MGARHGVTHNRAVNSDTPVTYGDVVAAAARIAPRVRRTPVLTFNSLDDEIGAEVFLKAEIFQVTGAYKARGALNAVLQLGPEAARGIVAHSSGNHGIALSWAASLLEVECTIVVPEQTNSHKLRALRRHKANIVFCGAGMREPAAEAERRRTGAVFIHPYEHPHVIAGHGTAALELFDQVADLDVVLTPIGGGSLLSSTAIVAEQVRPDARCVGAEPRAADDSHRSLLTGVRQPAVVNPVTVADALLGGIGERSFETLTRTGAQVMTVSDEQIIEAARYYVEQLKLVVEPSAATGLALLRTMDVQGLRVAIVVSGGNTDLAWLR